MGDHLIGMGKYLEPINSKQNQSLAAVIGGLLRREFLCFRKTSCIFPTNINQEINR